MSLILKGDSFPLYFIQMFNTYRLFRLLVSALSSHQQPFLLCRTVRWKL